MAKNYFKRYIWLIDLINQRGHITRREINERWRRNFIINEDREPEIPERTFHNHIASIFAIFGLEIKCDRTLGYYIANPEDLNGNGIQQWMLSSLSLNNLLNECKGMRDKVLFESVPSCEKYLSDILEAIRDCKAVTITYQSYQRPSATTFEAEPYCLKQFKQRWYMVAKTGLGEKPRIYALDRIQELKSAGREYEIPKDFSAEDYFRDYYGVCLEEGCGAEEVRIWVDNFQAKYFKSLKLHPSQKIVKEDDSGTEFSFRLVPTFDFIQELFSKMDKVRVLSPEWLRDEMGAIAKSILANYSAEEK